jgi:alpha-L-fucosidase
MNRFSWGWHLALFCWICFLSGEVSAIAYEPTWKSLAAHQEAPEWFRDAKFGIYFHWSVYAVAGMGQGYPRDMFKEGHPANDYHIAHYGDPREFGYHDLVPLFRAEHFDPEEWASLFEEAGAKFAGPVAEHHDGFAMWDSVITPWNSADRGPRRDITGEIAEALRNRGIRLVTTFHHARNFSSVGAAFQNQGGLTLEQEKDSDFINGSFFPYKPGFPTASDDPELQLMYGNMDEVIWMRDVWLGKLKEVIDRYQPDLIWFDYGLFKVPTSLKQEFVAYYLNRAAEWGKEVVITNKHRQLPMDVSLLDIERGGLNHLAEYVWLTDDTLTKGPWGYKEGVGTKEPDRVLHNLIDIVSKNGCLLLNIAPQADGTIPEMQRSTLLAIGAWLKRYGEAIYETRPWKIYGEGTAKMKQHPKYEGYRVVGGYSASDIRYTQSKDGKTLFAMILGLPNPGEEVVLKSFVKNPIKPESITLAGGTEQLPWRMTPEGLIVTMPVEHLPNFAVPLRIDLR